MVSSGRAMGFHDGLALKIIIITVLRKKPMESCSSGCVFIFFYCHEILELRIQCRYVREMTVTHIRNSDFPVFFFLIPFWFNQIPALRTRLSYTFHMAQRTCFPGTQPCPLWSRSTLPTCSLMLLFVPLLSTPTNDRV